MNIEHPAQLLTPHQWRERVRHDYAGGTLEAPTTLYLAQPGGTTLGPAELIEPRPASSPEWDKARMAHALLRGDESHTSGCASGAFRVWERRTCGTCALLGYPYDDEPVTAPNYAGWARVYTQAHAPVPRAWLAAFVAELNTDDNDRYREALRLDVVTYGYRLTDEAPGYRLPSPSPERLLAWLRDYNDDERAVLEALKEIMRNDEYDAASQRAAFRAFNRRLAPEGKT